MMAMAARANNAILNAFIARALVEEGGLLLRSELLGSDAPVWWSSGFSGSCNTSMSSVERGGLGSSADIVLMSTGFLNLGGKEVTGGGEELELEELELELEELELELEELELDDGIELNSA